MRKNDECNPRPERDLDEKGTQNKGFGLASKWAISSVARFIKSIWDGASCRFCKICKLKNYHVGIAADRNTPICSLKVKSEQADQSKKPQSLPVMTDLKKAIRALYQAVFDMSLTAVELNVCQMSVSEILQGLDSPAPSSDDMRKADEIQKRMEYLELCLASNDQDARLAEFNAELSAELIYFKSKIQDDKLFALIEAYTEVARDKNETLKVTLQKGFFAINKLDKSLSTLRRTSYRGKRFSEWLVLEIASIDSKPDPEKFLNKVTKFVIRLCKIFTVTHNSISAIAESHWDYLPKEFQEIVESQARQLFLRDSVSKSDCCELDASASTEPRSELAQAIVAEMAKFDDTRAVFIKSIFELVESSKSKPKVCAYVLHESLDDEFEDQKIHAQECSKEDEFGYTQEDRTWLNSDVSGLSNYGSYNFEPGERESFKPVQYVPGRGFVIFDDE